jgi:hypothetical protein
MGLVTKMEYVVVIEPELEREVLTLVQCALGALELHMPHRQVVGRQ